MRAWLELDHFVFSEIKKYRLLDRDFVICVSGGADSMALASIFGRVLKAHKLKLFHFHHGNFENRGFRDAALVLVQTFGDRMGIEVKVAKASHRIQSERQYREARLSALKDFIQKSEKGPTQVLAWAHHSQDLLETRLIRLIRGAGPEGLVGMSPWRSPHFRPLLARSRDEIRDYLECRKIDFLEDPSNQDQRFLRNWLRYDWFPRLERKRQGSLKTLSDSLETMAQAIGLQKSESDLGLSRCQAGIFLNRCVFLTLSEFDQNRALASLMFQSGCPSFRQSQIKEIRRRLDNGQNEHRIKIAGLYILVNAERIWVEVCPDF